MKFKTHNVKGKLSRTINISFSSNGKGGGTIVTRRDVTVTPR